MPPLRHYVGRFFGSVVPTRVRDDDRAWVHATLEPNEFTLWCKLGRADAVESIGVARRAEAALTNTNANTNTNTNADGSADVGDALAAALLHDVGKLDANLGTLGRVAATVAGKLAGVEMAEAWRHASGITRRFGLYLQHAELGAVRIRFVGGREVVAQWAEAHHDPQRWPDVELPLDWCRVLAEADGE